MTKRKIPKVNDLLKLSLSEFEHQIEEEKEYSSMLFEESKPLKFRTIAERNSLPSKDLVNQLKSMQRKIKPEYFTVKKE